MERLDLNIGRGILRAQMNYGLFYLNWKEKQTGIIRVTMPNFNHAEATTGAEIMADAMSGSNTELAATTGALLQNNAIDTGSMSVDVSAGAHIKITDSTCTSVSANAASGYLWTLKM